MKTPMYPRDGAGSFSIPSEKGEIIKAMCPLPDHLEIYSPTETFKIQSPESIDPERTNPNAMWVNAKTHDVGSSSPFVARTFIMASEILKVAKLPKPSEKDALTLRMHLIKELLLQCDSASKSVGFAVDSEIAALEATEFKLADGGSSLEKFPVVRDLESKATSFLIAARRAITEICQISNHFWDIKTKHSALEHLLEKELIPLLGKDHCLVLYLNGFVSGTKRILDFRNGQEHANTTKAKRLVVKNFELTSTNQIKAPVWYLEGNSAVDMKSEMEGVADFVLRLAEGMFVGCVDATLTKWPPFQFVINDPVDLDCPVQYSLQIFLEGPP